MAKNNKSGLVTISKRNGSYVDPETFRIRDVSMKSYRDYKDKVQQRLDESFGKTEDGKYVKPEEVKKAKPQIDYSRNMMEDVKTDSLGLVRDFTPDGNNLVNGANGINLKDTFAMDVANTVLKKIQDMKGFDTVNVLNDVETNVVLKAITDSLQYSIPASGLNTQRVSPLLEEKYPELADYVRSMRAVANVLQGQYVYNENGDDLSDSFQLRYNEETGDYEVVDIEYEEWMKENTYRDSNGDIHIRSDAEAPPLHYTQNGDTIDRTTFERMWKYFLLSEDAPARREMRIKQRELEAAELKSMTAGADETAVDSVFDVIRQALSERQNKVLDYADNETLHTSLILADSAKFGWKVLKGMQDYYTNYLVNPIKEGQWGTVFLNQLVNFSEVLDLFSVGVRSVIARNHGYNFYGSNTFEADSNAFLYVPEGMSFSSPNAEASEKARIKAMATQKQLIELGAMNLIKQDRLPEYLEQCKARIKKAGLWEEYLTFKKQYLEYEADNLGDSVFDALKTAYSTTSNFEYDTGSNIADFILYTITDPTLVVGGLTSSIYKGIAKNTAKQVAKDVFKEYGRAGINDVANDFVKSMGKRIYNMSDEELHTRLDYFVDRAHAIYGIDEVQVRREHFKQFSPGASSDVIEKVLKNEFGERYIPELDRNATKDVLYNSIKEQLGNRYATIANGAHIFNESLNKVDSFLLKNSVFTVPGYATGKFIKQSRAVARNMSYRRTSSEEIVRNQKLEEVLDTIKGERTTLTHLNSYSEKMVRANLTYEETDAVSNVINSRLKSEYDNLFNTVRPILLRTELEGVDNLENTINEAILKQNFVTEDGKIITSLQELQNYIEQFVVLHASNYSKIVEGTLSEYRGLINDLTRRVKKASEIKSRKQFLMSQPGFETPELVEQQLKKEFSLSVTSELEKAIKKMPTDIEAGFSHHLAPSFYYKLQYFKKVLKEYTDPQDYSVTESLTFKEMQDNLRNVNNLRNYLESTKFQDIVIGDLERYLVSARNELIKVLRQNKTSFKLDGKYYNVISNFLDDLRAYYRGITLDEEHDLVLQEFRIDRLAMFKVFLENEDIRQVLDFISDDTTYFADLVKYIKENGINNIQKELIEYFKIHTDFRDSISSDEIIDFISDLNSIIEVPETIKQYYSTYYRLQAPDIGLTETQVNIIMDTLFGFSKHEPGALLDWDLVNLLKRINTNMYWLGSDYKYGLDAFRTNLLNYNDKEFWGRFYKDVQDPDNQKKIEKLVSEGHIDPSQDVRVQVFQLILRDKDAIEYYNNASSTMPQVFFDVETTSLKPHEAIVTSIGWYKWDSKVWENYLESGDDLGRLLDILLSDNFKLELAGIPEDVIRNMDEGAMRAHVPSDIKIKEDMINYLLENRLLKDGVQTEQDILQKFMQESQGAKYISHSNNTTKNLYGAYVKYDFDIAVLKNRSNIFPHYPVTENSFDLVRQKTGSLDLTKEQMSYVSNILSDTLKYFDDKDNVYFFDIDKIMTSFRNVQDFRVKYIRAPKTFYVPDWLRSPRHRVLKLSKVSNKSITMPKKSKKLLVRDIDELIEDTFEIALRDTDESIRDPFKITLRNKVQNDIYSKLNESFSELAQLADLLGNLDTKDYDGLLEVLDGIHSFYKNLSEVSKLIENIGNTEGIIEDFTTKFKDYYAVVKRMNDNCTSIEEFYDIRWSPHSKVFAISDLNSYAYGFLGLTERFIKDFAIGKHYRKRIDDEGFELASSVPHDNIKLALKNFNRFDLKHSVQVPRGTIIQAKKDLDELVLASNITEKFKYQLEDLLQVRYYNSLQAALNKLLQNDFTRYTKFPQFSDSFLNEHVVKYISDEQFSIDGYVYDLKSFSRDFNDVIYESLLEDFPDEIEQGLITFGTSNDLPKFSKEFRKAHKVKIISNSKFTIDGFFYSRNTNTLQQIIQEDFPDAFGNQDILFRTSSDLSLLECIDLRYGNNLSDDMQLLRDYLSQWYSKEKTKSIVSGKFISSPDTKLGDFINKLGTNNKSVLDLLKGSSDLLIERASKKYGKKMSLEDITVEEALASLRYEYGHLYVTDESEIPEDIVRLKDILDRLYSGAYKINSAKFNINKSYTYTLADSQAFTDFLNKEKNNIIDYSLFSEFKEYPLDAWYKEQFYDNNNKDLANTFSSAYKYLDSSEYIPADGKAYKFNKSLPFLYYSNGKYLLRQARELYRSICMEPNITYEELQVLVDNYAQQCDRYANFVGLLDDNVSQFRNEVYEYVKDHLDAVPLNMSRLNMMDKTKSDKAKANKAKPDKTREEIYELVRLYFKGDALTNTEIDYIANNEVLSDYVVKLMSKATNKVHRAHMESYEKLYKTVFMTPGFDDKQLKRKLDYYRASFDEEHVLHKQMSFLSDYNRMIYYWAYKLGFPATNYYQEIYNKIEFDASKMFLKKPEASKGKVVKDTSKGKVVKDTPKVIESPNKHIDNFFNKLDNFFSTDTFDKEFEILSRGANEVKRYSDSYRYLVKDPKITPIQELNQVTEYGNMMQNIGLTNKMTDISHLTRVSNPELGVPTLINAKTIGDSQIVKEYFNTYGMLNNTDALIKATALSKYITRRYNELIKKNFNIDYDEVKLYVTNRIQELIKYPDYEYLQYLEIPEDAQMLLAIAQTLYSKFEKVYNQRMLEYEKVYNINVFGHKEQADKLIFTTKSPEEVLKNEVSLDTANQIKNEFFQRSYRFDRAEDFASALEQHETVIGKMTRLSNVIDDQFRNARDFRIAQLYQSFISILKDLNIRFNVNKTLNYKSVDNYRMRLQTQHIMEYISESSDNLLAHILHNHQFLVLSKSGQDNYVKLLHKVLDNFDDKYLYKLEDYNHIYIGVKREYSIEVSNSSKFKKAIRLRDTNGHVTKTFAAPKYDVIGVPLDGDSRNKRIADVNKTLNNLYFKQINKNTDDRFMLFLYSSELKEYIESRFPKMRKYYIRSLDNERVKKAFYEEFSAKALEHTSSSGDHIHFLLSDDVRGLSKYKNIREVYEAWDKRNSDAFLKPNPVINRVDSMKPSDSKMPVLRWEPKYIKFRSDGFPEFSDAFKKENVVKYLSEDEISINNKVYSLIGTDNSLNSFYSDMDYLMEGNMAGSLGVVHDFKRQIAMMKLLPQEFLDNITSFDAMRDSRLWSIVEFDRMVLGEAPRFRNIFDYEQNFISNMEHTMSEVAGAAQAQNVYVHSLFNDNNLNTVRNFFDGYSDEEVLDVLRDNDEFVVVDLRTANNISGLSVHACAIRDLLDVKTVRESKAVLVPYEVYMDLVQQFNTDGLQNKFAQLWAQIMVYMKVGHLSNPGTWLRNWIDATIKATGDVGNFKDTAINQIKASRLLYEYQNLLKQVEQKSHLDYHSKTMIKKHWNEYHTTMTFEEFSFMESWMRQGLSGGESARIKALKRRTVERDTSNYGKKYGRTDDSDNLEVTRVQFNPLGDDIEAFTNLEISEIQDLVSDLSEFYWKDMNMSKARFFELLQAVKDNRMIYENHLEYSRFDDIVHDLIYKRAERFDSVGQKYSREMSKVFKGLLTPMSMVEEVVRLGEYLALEEQGYTRNQIFKRITDSQFNYDLKTTNMKRAELVFLYFTFDKCNLVYWCRSLSENPRMLRWLEEIWGSLSWDACYDYVTDTEDPYANQSLAYAMSHGAIPIGDRGLYLKTNPSFLSALQYLYSGPDFWISNTAAPIETLTRDYMDYLGADYRSLFSEFDFNEDQSVWKQVMESTPIVGTVYDRWVSPRHVRKTWMRLFDIQNGTINYYDDFYTAYAKSRYDESQPSIQALMAYAFPSIFGVVKLYGQQNADSFNEFQKQLAAQGKWYDLNKGKVVSLEEYNTYGLNNPDLDFDELNRLKLALHNQIWDNNQGKWVDPKDFQIGGLNRDWNFKEHPEDWETFCKLKELKNGLKWDNNQGKFVSLEEYIPGGLNSSELEWADRCQLMYKYRGLCWDSNQQCFVDEAHYIPGGLNGNVAFGEIASPNLDWDTLTALKYALHGEVWDNNSKTWIKVAEPKDIKMYFEDDENPIEYNSNTFINQSSVDSKTIKDFFTFTSYADEERTVLSTLREDANMKNFVNTLLAGNSSLEHNQEIFQNLISSTGSLENYYSGYYDGYYTSPRTYLPKNPRGIYKKTSYNPVKISYTDKTYGANAPYIDYYKLDKEDARNRYIPENYKNRDSGWLHYYSGKLYTDALNHLKYNWSIKVPIDTVGEDSYLARIRMLYHRQ